MGVRRGLGSPSFPTLHFATLLGEVSLVELMLIFVDRSLDNINIHSTIVNKSRWT